MNNNAAVGSSKTWELSDYELHRTPQDALTDGSEIAVSPRALHSELMCPICLDMLHQTMTTKGKHGDLLYILKLLFYIYVYELKLT